VQLIGSATLAFFQAMMLVFGTIDDGFTHLMTVWGFPVPLQFTIMIVFSVFVIAFVMRSLGNGAGVIALIIMMLMLIHQVDPSLGASS
jgi:hypothetical protein